MHINQHYPQLHFFIVCVTVNGVNDNTLFARIDRIAGLAWGVHTPFWEYIQRIPDGLVAVHNGAKILESGATFFPLDAASATAHELRFVGDLEFRGHNGMMAVTVQQPWLQCHGERWQLTIVDPFEPGSRMPIVDIELHDEATGTARLTESGTDLFMGNYNEGTLFDPVRIVWAEKDQDS